MIKYLNIRLQLMGTSNVEERGYVFDMCLAFSFHRTNWRTICVPFAFHLHSFFNIQTKNTEVPPSAAAPLGLCSLFLLIYFLILWIFMAIPCIFLIYSMYICPKYFPYIFLCMFVIYSVNSMKIMKLFSKAYDFVKKW